jgi:DNA mismatch repair protein MutS2
MNERSLTALEYEKFLQHLAEFCVSESAREAALLLRPLPSCSEAREAALLFEESRMWSTFADDDAGERGYRLAAFPEIRPLTASFASGPGAAPDIDDLWAVREMLREAGKASASILAGANADGPALPRLARLASFPAPERSTAELERCLSDEATLRDESSPELLAVRLALRDLHRNCLNRVKSFIRQYNMEHLLQDEFMTLASDRYVLLLKADFRGRMQGIIHSWSQTGESCYFEPLFLADINNRVQEFKRREHEEERKILNFLASLVRNELPSVEAAFAFLVRLDLLLAQARLADAARAECLSLGETEEMELIEARHPLLALNDSARPVDVILRAGERGLVISGGNAGGKTVCLKTLGLIGALALTGLPVPAARGSRLPAWTDIHAFIGDEQSLDDGLSTFSARVRHLSEVWEGLGPHSLLLLDEFGAGTDPAQGAALARAVLDEALELGAFVVAATHFPALKIHALNRPSVRSASVLFDPSSRKPLFRLAYDQVGTSRTLAAAREYGLPESVLRRAERYLSPGAAADEELIMARLNELAVEREAENLLLGQERERQRKKTEALQARLERERQALHDEVRAEARELMRAWKEGRAAHRQALREMARLRASLASPPPPRPETPLPADLKAGMRVLYRPFGRQGAVTDVDARKNRVRLDMEGVSLWADIADVAPQEQPGSFRQTGARFRNPDAGGTPLRLDLRGKRVDAAINELCSFLDKALLSGIGGVEILHGRGTGALRREVHDFLKSFPGIAETSLAPEDRGGDGLTLVTFK